MRRLPDDIHDDGLLVGWSLEPELRKRRIGFAPPPPANTGRSPASTLEPILDTSEGHLITVAPTGAGKGTGCIVPALLRYRGPVVVVDPKGENYAVTARHRRALGQKVVLLDPFRVAPAEERHRFNPLDLADPASDSFIEDTATLAQLVSANPAGDGALKEPFWNQMGRTLTAAAILDVLTMRDSEDATLPAVRALINQPLSQLAERAKQWHQAEHPELRRMAGLIANPAEATLGGYWALSVNQLDFLKGALLDEHLSGSDLDLNEIYDGAPLSVYLVLPPSKLESHAALLRLWIGTLISVITRRSRRPALATLMLIDEAAQLGELPQLRQAVTLLRGYGVRVWSFWQDLSQMRQLYPADWETLLNNCRIQQFFGAATALSADAIAAVSGFGPREAVLALERDEMILNVAGDEPVVARKPNYRFDRPFAGRFDDNPFYAGISEDRDEVRARPVFRRSQAPAARLAARQARQASILANDIFHPVHEQQWQSLAGDERDACLAAAGITDETFRCADEVLVRRCALPFYAGYDWIEIEDRRNRPAAHGYYALAVEADREPVALTGASQVIYELNRRAPLRLGPPQAKLYLEFFCTNVHGDAGRFLILDSAQEIEWEEPPEASFLEDLARHVRPPRLAEPAPGDPWTWRAEVLYDDTVYSSLMRVDPTSGEVEMLEDTAVASDLAVVRDVSRLAYVGRFTADGAFEALRSGD